MSDFDPEPESIQCMKPQEVLSTLSSLLSSRDPFSVPDNAESIVESISRSEFHVNDISRLKKLSFALWNRALGAASPAPEVALRFHTLILPCFTRIYRDVMLTPADASALASAHAALAQVYNRLGNYGAAAKEFGHGAEALQKVMTYGGKPAPGTRDEYIQIAGWQALALAGSGAKAAEHVVVSILKCVGDTPDEGAAPAATAVLHVAAAVAASLADTPSPTVLSADAAAAVGWCDAAAELAQRVPNMAIVAACNRIRGTILLKFGDVAGATTAASVAAASAPTHHATIMLTLRCAVAAADAAAASAALRHLVTSPTTPPVVAVQALDLAASLVGVAAANSAALACAAASPGDAFAGMAIVRRVSSFAQTDTAGTALQFAQAVAGRAHDGLLLAPAAAAAFARECWLRAKASHDAAVSREWLEAAEPFLSGAIDVPEGASIVSAVYKQRVSLCDSLQSDEALQAARAAVDAEPSPSSAFTLCQVACARTDPELLRQGLDIICQQTDLDAVAAHVTAVAASARSAGYAEGAVVAMDRIPDDLGTGNLCITQLATAAQMCDAQMLARAAERAAASLHRLSDETTAASAAGVAWNGARELAGVNNSIDDEDTVDFSGFDPHVLHAIGRTMAAAGRMSALAPAAQPSPQAAAATAAAVFLEALRKLDQTHGSLASDVWRDFSLVIPSCHQSDSNIYLAHIEASARAASLGIDTADPLTHVREVSLPTSAAAVLVAEDLASLPLITATSKCFVAALEALPVVNTLASQPEGQAVDENTDDTSDEDTEGSIVARAIRTLVARALSANDHPRAVHLARLALRVSGIPRVEFHWLSATAGNAAADLSLLGKYAEAAEWWTLGATLAGGIGLVELQKSFEESAGRMNKMTPQPDQELA